MREHGTNARYHIDGCRCRPCRDAANAHARHRSRMIAYGRWQPYVDAQPAREHCQALLADGMGPVTIARISGVPHGAVSKLLYGDYSRDMAPSRRIRPETEARLLAVEAKLDNLADAALIDVCGTRRRLQALACIGWPLPAIGALLDREPSNLWRVQRRSRHVQADTARAVRDLYERLCMTPYTGRRASVTRQRAADAGWTPPLGWDEGEIDDPDAKPRTRGCSPSGRGAA